VDELTENIAIIYNKEMFQKNSNNSSNKYTIDNQTIPEIITELANSKAKKLPSLSNKSIFKFMDIVEM
jgi:hypothetical protein